MRDFGIKFGGFVFEFVEVLWNFDFVVGLM